MSRQVTNLILEYIDEGILDKDLVIEACLEYMSEDDVVDMALSHELITDYHLHSPEDLEYDGLDYEETVLRKHGFDE